MIEKTDDDLREALNLLYERHEGTPCRFDHHGYCQEHGWLAPGECDQPRMERLLRKYGYDVD